ncbi:MAG: hypothetical protein WCS21_08530 [Lachnospiraceae bacterium]
MNKQKKESKDKSITDIIEEIKADFCDNYCKFQGQYGDSPEEYDQMLENECSRCPMNRF